MSDSNSRFAFDSVNYLHADIPGYVIRSVYNANGGNHSYKLYYNDKFESDITIPGVKTVEAVSDYLENLRFYYDYQSVNIRFDYAHRDDGSLNSISLSELISVSFDHSGTEIVGFNEKRDFTRDQDFMVYGSDGTYIVFHVYVEWVCITHKDDDKDFLCDYCEYDMTPEGIIGDVTGDSVVNFIDVMMILRIAADSIQPTEQQLHLADATGDGIINFLDAMTTLRIAAEY
jgi:hypothetical protein